MRNALFAALLALIPACGQSSNGTDDMAAPGADMAAPAGDMASGGGDMPRGTDGGIVGAACNTACDCMPGLACFNKMCLSGVVPVYCCETNCPPQMRNACQHMNGNYGQCGSNGSPPDLSGFDPC